MRGTSTLPRASSEIPMVWVSGLVRVPRLGGSGGGGGAPPFFGIIPFPYMGVSYLGRSFIILIKNIYILRHITYCTIATGSTAPNTGLDPNYFH